MKYKSPEADVRNSIIKEFLSMGIKVKRIENSINGRHKSIPDLLFFDPVTKVFGFIEVKSLTGRLSTGKDSQQEFKDLCEICHVNHWVVRSLDDAINATGRREYERKMVEGMEL